MYALIASLLLIFIILVFSEVLWRKKKLKPEVARKMVHVLVGLVVATWPFYIQFNYIVVLGAVMMSVVTASKALNIFTSIHSVKRSTYGEVFFAGGIILAAILTNSPWIFAAAILHVSLADGLAGLIGSGLKKPIKYFVFSSAKSVQGTAVFFVFSMAIFAAAIYFDTFTIPDIALPVIAVYSLVIACIENISPKGSDDVVVPVAVVVLLELLRITN